MSETGNPGVRPPRFPGHGRVVVQFYDVDDRAYRQPPGFSLAKIKIRNKREMGRLWEQLQAVIEDGRWRDRNQGLEGASAERDVEMADSLLT
jgi:hypothetical protein